MQWPPNKAWTSTTLRVGFRHFVAINYGGKGVERWVQLVSVLEGKARLKVLWKELKDNSKWKTGWLQLPRDEANPENYCQELITEDELKKTCLHPSKDSGLTIPYHREDNRPWFEDIETKKMD